MRLERAASAATDVVCPMYPEIDAIVDWAATQTDDPRPMILCEYSHAMGNTNGCLADYFAAFERHGALQGGFIWEWVDHGIRQRGPRAAASTGPTAATSARAERRQLLRRRHRLARPDAASRAVRVQVPGAAGPGRARRAAAASGSATAPASRASTGCAANGS